MHKCSQKVEECFSHFKILLISQLSIKCHGETIPNTAEEKGTMNTLLLNNYLWLIWNWSKNYSYYNSSWVSHTHAKKLCIEGRKSKRSWKQQWQEEAESRSSPGGFTALREATTSREFCLPPASTGIKLKKNVTFSCLASWKKLDPKLIQVTK